MYKHKLNADKRQNWRYGHKYWNRKKQEYIGGTYKKRSPYHEDRSCASEYLVLSQPAVFDAERDYPKTTFINEQTEISSLEQIGSAPPGGMPPCFFKKIYVHKSYVAPSLSRIIHKYDPT